MMSMDVNHPDIEEFINVKKDLNKVTKANISVRVDNSFMKKVTGEDPNPMYEATFVVDALGKQVIKKEINAKKLFKMLCTNNYDYAEPGILFWDRIKNYNILSKDDNFSYAGVNPCFTGDMRILTKDGFKPLKDLCDTKPYIYSYDGRLSQGKVWCSGEKEIVKITLSNGSVLRCTPNHRFMTTDRKECLAKDLFGKRIMSVSLRTGNKKTFTIDTDIKPIVLSVENDGKELVYDFEEPLTHWGIIEGFVAHNCAEFSAQSKN